MLVLSLNIILLFGDFSSVELMLLLMFWIMYVTAFFRANRSPDWEHFRLKTMSENANKSKIRQKIIMYLLDKSAI